MGVDNIESFLNLANMIVQLAASDYVYAIKALERNPKNIEMQRQYNDCKRFFLSHWYSCLTDIDGTEMIETLEKKCAKRQSRRGRRSKSGMF